MRKIYLITSLIILFNISTAQNLIENSGFENGPIPNAANQVSFANSWIAGCGDGWLPSVGFLVPGTPDLFDDRSSNCIVDIPSNKWAVNTTERTGGHRYIGITGGTNIIARDGNYHYKESVLGTLKEQLNANCEYTIAMWAAATEGYSQTSYPCNVSQITNSPSNAIQVVLRKTNCNGQQKIIFTSNSTIPKRNWTNLIGTFTLTTAEAAVGYDKIEFRMALQNQGFTSRAVFLDDVSLTPPSLPTSNFTLPDSICYGLDLFADGTNSTNEQNHQWSVTLSDQWWNTTWDPTTTWSSGWITGQANNSNLTTLCNLNLIAGNFYRVRLAVSNCVSAWEIFEKLIYIIPPPFVDVGVDKKICQGQSTMIGNQLYPLGITYSWIGTSQNSSYANVNPNTTTSYILTATNEVTGCSASDSVTVYIDEPIPNLSISQSNSNLCSNAITLYVPNIQGANYLWLPGNQTTNSITITPNVTTQYTCIVTNSCASSNATITINPSTILSGNFPSIVGGLFVFPYQPTVIYDNTLNANVQPAYNAIEYQVKVWNRWGNLIYDYTDYDNINGFYNGEIQWNGIANISVNYSWWQVLWYNYQETTAGQYAPQGAYVLQVRLRNCDYNHWVITNQTVTVIDSKKGSKNIVTDPLLKSETTNINAITSEEKEIIVYPNPTNGIVNVKINNINSKIILSDFTGKILQEKNTSGQELKLNLSNQPSGIYFLKIITDDKVVVKQIIKQ